MSEHYPFHTGRREAARERGAYYLGAVASDHTRAVLREKARKRAQRRAWSVVLALLLAALCAAFVSWWTGP